MTGTFIPVNASYESASITDATGFDFGGYFTGGTDNTFAVATATGDFSSLVAGTLQQTGIIENFQFTSFVPTPGVPLWSVGDFSFEMTSLIYERKTLEGNTNIYVYGLGLMSAVGYENTPGVWNFTGQGVANANYSWSASAGAAPVPEPATMLLFGTGLIGLAAMSVRRRKKQNQAM